MGLRPAGGLFGIVRIEEWRENMKRRLVSAILAICMVLLLLPAAALADEYYPVWVDGTRVTSANASNVLGNGTVSYTPCCGWQSANHHPERRKYYQPRIQ